VVEEFDAAHLFDLPSGASIYRVFLLPGCLQFDLSFTPASKFGAIGPKIRDYALSLACRRRGLAASYGRGFDELPAEVRNSFLGALVSSLERDELLRALGYAIEGLLREGDQAQELAAKVEPQLRKLTAAWDT
jgi:hypothetical protein